MKRRSFFTWIGFGWLGSFLPLVIAACSSRANQEKSSVKTGEFKAVGNTAELDKSGFLLNKKSPADSVLVVRHGNNLVAVNPTCTHAGCIVAWRSQSQKFACPCHGAEFATDGKVLKGPAAKPLKTYIAKIEGNSVVVNQSS